MLDNLKSRSHWHHQMLCHLPWCALLGLYYSHLLLLFVCGTHWFQFYLPKLKKKHALKNSWFAFAVDRESLSFCNMKHHLISCLTSGWICVESIGLYTSAFSLRLLSAVTPSVHNSDPVPLAARHAHAIPSAPPCLTDKVLCFRSGAVCFLACTFLFPSC